MNGPQAVNQAEQYLSEQELFAHLKCEVSVFTVISLIITLCVHVCVGGWGDPSFQSPERPCFFVCFFFGTQP